ncbi:hypothetical protein TRIUR3_03782 [Triticum urartu]|uniref:Amino acid transporter transmembrane domain-containing protein n=1 Tax=Triticum urartu TaxID=4572 RepID=M7ZYX7_TRIUA|nr:hypothetical protein TRIUR3_03782 [Triticum urartu]
MVGPTVLTLPYALRGMGWALGLTALTAVAAVTFYTYYLMSRVLDHCEAAGRRHIRFRELAADVLGSGWVFYAVVTVQTAINAGITIGSILIAGNCLQIMYESLAPDGTLKLYHFIIIVAIVLSLFSQMPSFHSLRYINLGSLVLAFGYTILVSGACIRAGMMGNAPVKDYSLSPSKSGKMYDAFLSISILATVFGNGILPEIQATLAPPAAGKMVKALVLCYTVVFFTFYLSAISGYWAFGNKVQSNALQSLMPDSGPSLAPTWLLGLAVVLVLLQLLAIALVYSQVAYEIMEKGAADAGHGRFSWRNLSSWPLRWCTRKWPMRSWRKGRQTRAMEGSHGGTWRRGWRCEPWAADAGHGRFSWRNLAPRVALRTLYVAACAFVAAALPFFGDIVGVVGALGFIPLDFVLPVVMYNMALAPPKRSAVYVINVAIMALFTGVGIIGAIASVRKLVLDAGQFQLFSDHVVS